MRDDAPTTRMGVGLVSLPPHQDPPRPPVAGYRRLVVIGPAVAVIAGLAWIAGPDMLPLPASRAVLAQLHQLLGALALLATAAGGTAWMLASVAREREQQHERLAEEIRANTAGERIRAVGELQSYLRQLREAVAAEGDVEERLREVEETLGQVTTVEGIVRRATGGTVTPLRPRTGA